MTRFRIALLSVAGLAFSAAAVAQDKQLSDAQVEASVLRALAGASELSTQNIQTTTVYGVVTISGTTSDEASRTKAENIVARVDGVKKVVDQLTLGASTAVADASANVAATPSDGTQPAPGSVLQSDGTYAPANANAQQATEQGQPMPPPPAANGAPNAQLQQQSAGNYPPPPPNGANPYPNAYPPARRPMYNRNGYPPQTVEGGQEAGRLVTVPSGSMLRVRINQGLSTKHSQVGSSFDGTVLSDVVADGAVAIPRGAAIRGTVVNVEDAGALKGRGQLALQINGLTLGGKSFTLVSDTWLRNGKDKSLHTVNSALGLGAIGALFGAAAGGGAGAAIGAGVGGAAGVASSAASPDGKVIIPPEAVLTFHLAQPVQIVTVGEAEMARLSYAAGPGNGQPVAVRRRYPVYYAPYPYGPY